MKQSFKYIMIILVGALFTTACNKDFEWDRFALNNDDSEKYCIKLDQNTSGSTRVSVFSDSEWYAELENDIDWGHIENGKGNGSGYFTFHYDSNTDAERRAYVLVHSKGETKRILLLQAGASIIFRFRAEDSEMVVEKDATTYYLALDANISSDLAEYVTIDEVEYLDTQSGWVSNVKYVGKQLALDVALNDTGLERSAKLGITFTDPYTEAVYGPSYVTIQQGTESSIEISWDTLMEKFNEATNNGASGSWVINIDPMDIIGSEDGASTISEDNKPSGVKITGVNLSFPGNGNAAMNTQSVWTGGNFPQTNTEVNDATTYFMSPDGKYSFKLQMTSSKENIIPRYAKAQIRLNGATLRREGEGRYLISNVPSRSVVSIISGVEADIPVRERTIKELTSDDYYRIVKIKDVELVYNSGALYNSTDGYRNCCDYYPTRLRDKDGSSLYMMLSYATRHWSRNGNPAPRGSGNITGILTYETSSRYGSNGELVEGSTIGAGSLGKFAIRPFEAGCIELDAMEENNFSQIHTSWNWNDTKINLDESGKATLAKVGEGKIYHQSGIIPRLGNNFNGLTWNSSKEGTEIAKSACSFEGGAWVTTDGQFKGVVIEFNATTLGAGASLNIAYWGGTQGTTGVNTPANWRIEWSADGETFTPITGSEFDLHPFVWWAADCPTFSPHGLSQHTVLLPAEMSGAAKAYLRIVPYTYICASKSDPEGGLYSASTTNGRFTLADVTIKYNK